MSKSRLRRLRKKEQVVFKFLLRFIWPAFFAFAVFAFGLFFWGTSRFDPSVIKIEGNKRVKAEEIVVVVKPFFTDKHMFLFSGNVFIFNHKGARARLMEFFPRISDAFFKVDWHMREVTVLVEDRTKPAAIWCGSPAGIDACYNIDEDGVAFEEALPSQGLLLLTVKNERDQDLKQIGEAVIDKDFLTQLIRIRDVLKETSQVGVSRIILEKPDEVVAETLEGWRVIFVDSRPIQDQIVALREILKAQIPKEKRAGLDYIDLRVSERAYYKYK